MQRKRIIKIVGLLVACAAVGSFLYSRTQIDYEEQILSNPYDAQVSIQLNSQNETKEGNVEVSEQVSFPDYYEKEVDESLSFQVEVILEKDFNPQEVYSAKATRFCIDQDVVYDYFFAEAPHLTKTDIDNYRDDETSQFIPFTIYKDAERFCSMSKYDFMYYTKRINYIQQVADTNSTSNEQAYKVWDYSQDSNLDFMDREAAQRKMYACLEALHLDSTYAHIDYMFSMDLETMKLAEQKALEIGNISRQEINGDWSVQKDEGYYYYITQSFCNIPIYPYKTVQEEVEYRTPIKIMQTAEGYNLINFQRWFTIEKQDNKLELLPFEMIMGAIEDKYSGLLHTNPMIVKQAKLYHFMISTAENEYILLPVWVCRMEETSLEYGDVKSIYIPINAITGEEMQSLEN